MKIALQFQRDFVAPSFRLRESGYVIFVCCRILKCREPDKDILARAHRQSRESVFAIFRYKIRRNFLAQACCHGLERVLEEIDKLGIDQPLKITNGRDDQALRRFIRSHWRPLHIFKRESRCRKRCTQQQDVISVNHRSIGSFPERFPNRPAVKISQRFCARGHITKTSEPNKAIRIINVSKLSDDLYSDRLLRFDKFPLKEINQSITFPREQRVLPQLNDRTTESRRLRLFRTFSDWRSHDSLKHSRRGNGKRGSGAGSCCPESSPRWPLKPGFGQINITLDSAQGLIVDGLFVAQLDRGVAFCL